MSWCKNEIFKYFLEFQNHNIIHSCSWKWPVVVESVQIYLYGQFFFYRCWDPTFVIFVWNQEKITLWSSLTSAKIINCCPNILYINYVLITSLDSKSDLKLVPYFKVWYILVMVRIIESKRRKKKDHRNLWMFKYYLAWK